MDNEQWFSVGSAVLIGKKIEYFQETERNHIHFFLCPMVIPELSISFKNNQQVTFTCDTCDI